jgi:hypothetical protein
MKLIIPAAPLLAALAVVALTPGCGEDDVSGPRRRVEHPRAELVGYTGCKSLGDLAASREAAQVMECVEYRLQGGDTLFLKHVNACFNCCPGGITADVTIHNDTIAIAEHEGTAGCHCLCLFDLDYRIDNIPAGTYTLEFVDQYVTDPNVPLVCTMDLASAPSDTICVKRSGYPWNAGGGSEPFGVLVSHTDCRDGMLGSNADGTPTDLSCIEWRYEADNVLTLTHVNAAFNCCPGEIAADITIADGTITIAEHEEQSMCDCNCLYDLVFEIWNLDPAPYTIKVVEPYAQPTDERLEFNVDLASLPTGVKCAYRPHYPWGYQSTMPDDKAVLDRLREKIIEFIGTPSCAGADDCRCIGAGIKPCGGPWEYLIYSIQTVDEDALEFRVSFYNELYRGYNIRYHLSSTCDVTPPPNLGCVGGVCTDVNRK